MKNSENGFVANKKHEMEISVVNEAIEEVIFGRFSRLYNVH